MLQGTKMDGAKANHSSGNDIRLFISYSWSNKLQRKLLVDKLRAAGYATLCDEQFIGMGEELSKSILEAMDSAHGLVALLTKEALKSIAVREELTRAHSQRLPILALVEKSATIELPWFIKQTRRYEFTNQRDFEGVLEDFVCDIAKQNLSNYESVLLARQMFLEFHRVWKKNFPVTTSQRWRLELANRIVENASSEILSLNTHQFCSIVGGGHNFLMRAKPVFEQASSVYAVSLDSVSKFWVSEKRIDQQVALEYWKAQPSQTHRLFVFGTPESAHEYATILNIHTKKYGATGGVFLCSTAAYHRLLESIGIATHKEDFAVLEYETTAGPAIFKATLDVERFTVVRELSKGVVKEMAAFKEAISQLLHLAPGQLDLTNQVMRWQENLQNDRETWAQRLNVLFGPHKPDLFHIVFIASAATRQADVNVQLRALMRELRELLSSVRNSESVRLKDFWVGDYHPVPAYDSRTNGRILNSEASNFPRMLLMRFDDEESLRRWYADEAHSALRRRIYELVDPSLPPLFARIDAAEGPSSELYEKIEQLASKHLSRRDYKESDTIDDIVCRKPFKPKIRFD